MGKNKKKQNREPASEHMIEAGVDIRPCPVSSDAVPVPDGAPTSSDPAGVPTPDTAPAGETVLRDAARPPIVRPRRRIWPDLIKVLLAVMVIAVGVVVWYQPLLIDASYPYVSYVFEGKTATDAKLYRPLAMPTRYYIELPRQLANRYQWFAVDRRREVAALTEAPKHRLLGQSAIKRSDPLGLDLEFRKLDGSEWQVHFFPDAIVFSNAALTVRMDTKDRN
jgi:hypothetical protein